jgi:hypothetical protein
VLALGEPKGKNRAGHEYKRPQDARAVRCNSSLEITILSTIKQVYQHST